MDLAVADVEHPRIQYRVVREGPSEGRPSQCPQPHATSRKGTPEGDRGEEDAEDNQALRNDKSLPAAVGIHMVADGRKHSARQPRPQAAEEPSVSRASEPFIA
eukprot:CAMPEP_0180686798 /NCGR_PEP_ID=MMETSP1037_2-20121125/73110_1 /TAXON_ID=632150 /ORGANISM="Azadinium spinosum, Strain 3D9" /LENGTH=102 /DNA_ID=CAMNT_0022717537 /DNA_START=425 /DNA_END=731 /DNA_ORIENTATION=+